MNIQAQSYVYASKYINKRSHYYDWRCGRQLARLCVPDLLPRPITRWRWLCCLQRSLTTLPIMLLTRKHKFQHWRQRQQRWATCYIQQLHCTEVGGWETLKSFSALRAAGEQIFRGGSERMSFKMWCLVEKEKRQCTCVVASLALFSAISDCSCQGGCPVFLFSRCLCCCTWPLLDDVFVIVKIKRV